MAVENVELSPTGWVRNQTQKIIEAGTTAAAQVLDRPVVLVTMRGVKSGKLRYVPLMRVEHEGEYALVASKGGASEHPIWYHNLQAAQRVRLQDGTVTRDYTVRELDGDERAIWWERAVAAYPPYAEYQQKTDRLIPVFLAQPV